MSNPSTPQDFTNTIREILKRLRNLEGRGVGNNLTIHTDAEQHGINMINSDEDEMVRLGLLQSGNTSPVLDFASQGLAIFNSATGQNLTTLWVDYDKGFIFPYIPYSWQKSNDSVAVTSGTYVNVWETWVEAIPSDWFQFRFTVICPVGTTGDMKMVANGVTLGSVQAIGSGATMSCAFRIEHGLPINVGPYSISLQVRRLTGAGNISVFQPFNMFFGNPQTLPVGGWEIS